MKRKKNLNYENLYNNYLCLKCPNLRRQVCDLKILKEKSEYLKLKNGSTPFEKALKTKTIKLHLEKYGKCLLVWCKAGELPRGFYLFPTKYFNDSIILKLKRIMKQNCEMYNIEYDAFYFSYLFS